MKIEVHTHTGSGGYRPQPQIFKWEDVDLILILNIWGNSGLGSSLSEMFLQSFKNFKGNPGFPRLAASAQTLNDSLLKNENSTLWRTVVEVMALQRSGTRLSWCLVGDFKLAMLENGLSRPLAQLSSQSSLLPELGMGLESQFGQALGESQWTLNTRLEITSGLGNQDLEMPFWEASIDFSQ